MSSSFSEPSGPPLDVQVNAIDSQSLKVTWDVSKIIVELILGSRG